MNAQPEGCCELQSLGGQAPNDMPDESSVNVQLADELITILLYTWQIGR
jgi:hypothetical protein